MALLHLDFQSGSRQFPWGGLLLLASALFVSAWIGLYYNNLTGKIAYWETRMERGKISSDRSPADARQANELALEIKYVNGVLDKLTLPWDRLFQAVEWSSGREVALLGMEPDAEKHEVKISAEAKSLMAMTRYLRKLSEQGIFSNVYLQSHHVQLQIAEKPVRFTLIASWKAMP